MTINETPTMRGCPFYGFHHNEGTDTFVDGIENQCALTNKHCSLYPNTSPNLADCTTNIHGRQKQIERYQNTIQIFPNKLRPKDNSPWFGIPLREWMAYFPADRPLRLLEHLDARTITETQPKIPGDREISQKTIRKICGIL